jgi:hypothetical protein
MIVLIDEFENHFKLNTLLFRSKRNKAKENKNRYIYEHMANLQILTYDMFTLLRWFENIHKLNILPLNPKQYHWSQRKAKTNKKKIKKQGTCDNDQIWKSYQDAYFEPLW